ncbi:MAG: hypothetical protein AAGC46_07355 [Solirubrobacteraceae bacterium]|nr:hypothetical protein [Patulibacter sp.]
MSRPDAEDFGRGPKRPDDRPLMKPAPRPMLRPMPRAATERLQAVIAADAEAKRRADPAEPTTRGRRKFRDQSPVSGPQRRRKG